MRGCCVIIYTRDSLPFRSLRFVSVRLYGFALITLSFRVRSCGTIEKSLHGFAFVVCVSSPVAPAKRLLTIISYVQARFAFSFVSKYERLSTKRFEQQFQGKMTIRWLQALGPLGPPSVECPSVPTPVSSVDWMVFAGETAPLFPGRYNSFSEMLARTI